MPRSSFPSAASLLRDAWAFAAKQRALAAVAVWFLIVPNTLLDWLSRVGASPSAQTFVDRHAQLQDLLWLFLWVVLVFLSLWGGTCILFLGRRLILSRVGRARTSLRTVAKDAFPWILPLLLTTLLQACFLFYRALLYLLPALGIILFWQQSGRSNEFLILLLLSPILIPAVLYALRTFFFDIAVVCEQRNYRAALERSRELTHGKLLPVTWTLLLLALCLWLPAQILSSIIDWGAGLLHPSVPFVADLLDNMIGVIASVLFAFASIALYGHLQQRPQRIMPD